MMNEKKYTLDIEVHYENVSLEDSHSFSCETLDEARQLFQNWKSSAEKDNHCYRISIELSEGVQLIDSYNAVYENLFEVCDD